MKGFGPYASARVPDRKYLWTVVGLFGLLGLVGLGALVYRPLRVQRAISRLDAVSPDDGRANIADYERELRTCMNATLAGNRQACAAIVRACRHDAWLQERRLLSPMLFELAASRPELLFALLNAESVNALVPVLQALEERCDAVTQEAAKRDSVIIRSYIGSVNTLIADLVERFEKRLSSPVPEARRVAQAALDFTRRRFARELAEAESHKAKEPAR